MCAQLLQLCLFLFDPMDCSLPGSAMVINTSISLWTQQPCLEKIISHTFKESQRGKDHPLMQSEITFLSEDFSEGAVAESSHFEFQTSP